MFEKIKKWLQSQKKPEWDPVNTAFRSVNVGDKIAIIRPSTRPKTDQVSKTDTIHYNKAYLLPHGKHQIMYDHEHFVYIDPLIDGRYFWFENEIDRRAMEKWDVFYHAYINKVADALTKENIQIVNPLKSDDESDQPTPRRNTQLWWDKNKMQVMLNKALKRMRRDGYVVYYRVKDAFPDYIDRGAYYIFSDKELEEIEWDDWGHPIKWKVHIELKNGAAALLNTDARFNRRPHFERVIEIKDCVYFDPNYCQDYVPKPGGSHFWPKLVDYHYILEAVSSFDQRLGNGMMMVTVPWELWANDTAMNKLEEKVMNVRTEKGLIIPAGKQGSNPPEFNWVGMQGVQVDFVGHLDKYEDNIAAGMGFPKRWLIGDQEGAMESSGKDKLQVHISLKEIFAKNAVNFVKAILKFHGQISSYNDADILPGFQLDLTDQEKAEMDLVKTENLVQKLQFLTPNEVRKEAGYGEIEGGDDLFAEQNNDAENQKDIETTKGKMSQTPSKKEVKADTNPFDNIRQIYNEYDVETLGKLMNVSPTTISKQRSALNSLYQPHLKYDALALSDSVQVQDDIYKIENAKLILPQSKYYSQYNANCIRSKEAILKAFNDPRNPKEYRIGVKSDDSHPSRIPLEVTNEDAIGTVKLKDVEKDGTVIGDIFYDLSIADRLLGDDNWLREYTQAGKKLGTSVALYSNDKPVGKDLVESDLDIRSFVFTRKPRNKEAGGK